MQKSILPFLLVLFCALAARADDTPSALETDPAGWTDLLPTGAELAGWKRVAYVGKPLAAKSPWSLDADGKTLRCDNTHTVEMFLTDKEFADGVFHVEWRFKKIEGGKGYNAGVFVRNSADGVVWHQAQVGSLNVGNLFGTTLKDGKPGPFNVSDKVPQRGKEAGEWNTYEITCKGRSITLWINGAVTATWMDCDVPSGLLGLEAEGYEIEFRNVKFKESR